MPILYIYKDGDLMNLSERAKIKQEIVQRTGCKTTSNVKEKILSKDMLSKCYMSMNDNLLFETSILGVLTKFELSGHPYEPVIYLKCVSNEEKSFSIYSESFFPNNKENAKEWDEFSKYLNGRILLNEYAIKLDNYIPTPNQMVAIEKSWNTWYLCRTDEKNVLDISGPFSKNTMIYIISNKEQKVYFSTYKYTDNEKEKYIYVHYRNLSDIKNLVLDSLFTYKDNKYEICRWQEGIEIRNTKNNEDSKYVYGLNLETSKKVSALNGKCYDTKQLFTILSKMFDADTTDCILFL